MAVGGATNVVLHLLALAGRVGVPLTLDRFDELSRRTPVIANVRPSGEHLVEQLHEAGGVPALLAELAPLLDLEALDRRRRVARRRSSGARPPRPRRDRPLDARSPPRGASPCSAAASPRRRDREAERRVRRAHAPPRAAVVFEDVYDVQARIDDPDLPVTPETVLVLRNSGPKGGPGMPEWGDLPSPRSSSPPGVTDVVRVSDARMSGTAFGTVVLHVAPEAAAAALSRRARRRPDRARRRGARLDLDVPAAEVRRRLDELARRAALRPRLGRLYVDHVLQADTGCDLDFLRAGAGEPR